MELALVRNLILLASVYGQGPYGSDVYNGSQSTTPGNSGSLFPGILPNTGAGWLILLYAILFLLAIGIFIWGRRSRRKD